MLRQPRNLIGVFLASLSALAWATVPLLADDQLDSPDQPAQAKKITYDDLAPLMRESCFGCHNADKAKGGLNLTTFATMMQGGSSGVVIEPGDLGSSYLYQLVTHESEPHMPLNSAKLPDAKLAIFRRFIEDGALERSGSKPQAVKQEHAELKLANVSLDKPDGPPPMPPRLPLEPVLHTHRAGAVTALAVSPWAPLAAVAGQQQVLLYNTDNFQLLGVLPFPEGIAHVLRFSRNGKLLLAGGGHEAKSGRVVLWDVTTGKRITEIGDEYDVVLAADISPDQSLVALGGPSKVVRIFSTATGELLNQIKKHTDWITALRFSPDNVLLATGDRSGGMFVWEAATAQEYLTLTGHTAAVTGLSWRSDGNMLASASDDSSIRLWEMENGKQVKTWNAHGGVQWVEFCRDGKLLTCGRDHQVKLWTSDGKQQGKNMPLPELAMRAGATTDASRIIAGDWSGELRVWNASDGKQLAALSANPPKLEELLTAAIDQRAARQAEHQRLAAAAEKSNRQAAESAAELLAAKHAQDAAEKAEKSSRSELADLQTQFDQATAEISNITSGISNRESAATILAEAVAKAEQSAEKVPDNAELAEAVTKLKTSSESLATELTKLRKSLDDRNHALGALRDKIDAGQQNLEKLAADVSAAQQQAEKLTSIAKSLADKAAADQQSAEKSATAIATAESDIQHWNDEIEFAQSPIK